jgi:hypothetical protein
MELPVTAAMPTTITDKAKLCVAGKNINHTFMYECAGNSPPYNVSIVVREFNTRVVKDILYDIEYSTRSLLLPAGLAA